MTELKFIRLKNKDDIVTEILREEGENGILIESPLKVVYFINPTNGKIGLNYQEWIFRSTVTDTRFVLPKDEILLVAIPSEQMVTAYYRSLDRIGSYYEEDDISEYDRSDSDDIQEFIDDMSGPSDEYVEDSDLTDSQSEYIQRVFANAKYSIH
jgi:hypothetical protein